MCSRNSNKDFRRACTSDAFVSRQPRDAKKGVRNWNWPLTGCFEWELRKTGFCEGGRVDGRVITLVYLCRRAHFDSTALESGLYYFKKWRSESQSSGSGRG